MATELSVINGHSNGLATIGVNFSDDQISLLKRTICQGASDDELSLFIAQCKRTKLDPFAKQIHAVKRWDKKAGREVMSIQTGIDGYRLIAERTAQYLGQTPALWCGLDGVWVDVWLQPSPPAAAKVGIWKAGFKEPVFAVALWTEYVQQYYKDNKWHLSPMWQKMGTLMISKCAEALALRKAFPQELSGIYTAEEMQQADTQVIDNQQAPAHTEAPALPAPVEVSPEMQTAWKKLRASLNKTLTAAKNPIDLAAKRQAFEDYCKMAETIWSQRTYHNEEETFGMLYERHKERVTTDEELNSPEGVYRWIDIVMKSNEKGMVQRVSEFQSQERLQNADCENALNERALQLGVASYADFTPDMDYNAPEQGSEGSKG